MSEKTNQNRSSVQSGDDGFRYLPTELVRVVIASCVLGFVLLVTVSYLAISYGDLAYLPLLVPGMFLFVRGLWIRRQWFSGEIEEIALRCLSCRSQALRGKIFSINSVLYRVVCSDDAESPTLYEFNLGRGAEMITQNSQIIFYLSKKNPKDPVAWRLI